MVQSAPRQVVQCHPFAFVAGFCPPALGSWTAPASRPRAPFSQKEHQSRQICHTIGAAAGYPGARLGVSLHLPRGEGARESCLYGARTEDDL